MGKEEEKGSVFKKSLLHNSIVQNICISFLNIIFFGFFSLIKWLK